MIDTLEIGDIITFFPMQEMPKAPVTAKVCQLQTHPAYWVVTDEDDWDWIIGRGDERVTKVEATNNNEKGK